jgi:acetoin utilization deacetylase AcuC-like enzyme
VTEQYKIKSMSPGSGFFLILILPNSYAIIIARSKNGKWDKNSPITGQCMRTERSGYNKAKDEHSNLIQKELGKIMAVTGLVYGEIYLKHYTGVKHPEQPERLLAILESLESAKLLDRLFRIEPVPVERSILELCHDPGYIDEFKLAAENARLFFHTHDCPLSPRTFEAALCAVGGVLKGADMVMEGKVKNCFCAVRPPGHHAERSRAMGFCYFNNIAIAARYLQTHHSLERIAVIDWDVHHGNGTQDIFEEDHTVYFASFHQDPSTCFPFTGKASETGKGKGEGYTRNFPVPPGAGIEEYLKAIESVEQAMEKFRPDFVLISAGFDAHIADPLAHVNLTREVFEELTRRVKTIAEAHADGRLVSVLEGGYELKALGESVAAHIQVLSEG